MRLGKYQLLRKLATGGMAEVFLAKTDGPMGFEKLLVIKRILPHLAEDPQFVAMFLGEAKLAAQLNHPNLVQIFDFGEAEGSYFIAMEYIDGPNLRLLVTRAREAGTPIPFSLSARIVSQAAEGLAYAHDLRNQLTHQPLHLIHRDVSPENILLSRSGAVKLGDFGIAKARGQSHHTQAGTVRGKVAYMAPEQLRGEPLDRRVDLYALGVVLYELCTGHTPFEADSDASMVRAVLYETPIPAAERVANLPVPLQNILARLLTKKREERYADCGTLHAELEQFIHQSGVPATGFVLSGLVTRLWPPAAAVHPLPGQALEQPVFTASAYAPTDPNLLNRPAGEASPLAAAKAAPAGRGGTGRRQARTRPEAFVFPTALGEEREAVEPVTLGLHRTDARRITASMPAELARRSGGAGRILATLVVLLGAGAAGAWFAGLIPHERVALTVPPEGTRSDQTPPAPTAGPAPERSAPATGTPPPAPATVAPPAAGAAGATAASSSPGGGTSSAESSARVASAGPAPSAAASPARTGASRPSGPTGSTGESTSPPAEPSRPTSTSAAPRPEEESTGEAPPPLAGTENSRETPPAKPGTGAGTGSSRSTAAGSRSGASLGPGAEAASAGSLASTGAAEPTAPPKKERRESDKDRLLGAFAEAQAAADAPATIRIESTPRLRVRMGERILGTTPLTVSVPAPGGNVDLELFDTGLGLSRTESLVLKPGDNGVHRVSVPKGTLELKVTNGTEVSVDGKSVGTTPLDPLSLYEGRHQIQLSKGDQRERRLVTIQGGETEVLEFNFSE